jgi:general secretion pathway protein M
MIAAVKEWIEGRSVRERWMLLVMSVLLAIVVLWLGVVWPVEGGLASGRERLDAALDRNAAVRAKAKALEVLPRGEGRSLSAPIAQVVSESAGEAGFTLERSQEQGPGRLDIAIASAKPQALFAWLATLEGQGITVDTLTAQPAPTAGTISVQAVLKGNAP